MAFAIRGLVLATFAAALLLPDTSVAVTCTDGVDCFCDCVENPIPAAAACQQKYGITAAISGVRWCEDFEAITLYDGRGTGTSGTTGAVGGADACVEGNENANCFGNTTSPLYGPWYDNTGGSATYRGFNSYWSRHYYQSGGCSWNPQATTPSYTLGVPCSNGNCGCQEYRLDNAWENTIKAQIDITREGEFNDEVGSLGAGVGVIDGKQIIAHRVPPGNTGLNCQDCGYTGGLHGYVSFNPGLTSWGMTQLVAYPTNLVASGILGSQWKQNEWDGPNSQNGKENEFMGWAPGSSANRGSDVEAFPLTGFMYHTTQQACQDALNAATVHHGLFTCSGAAFRYGPEDNGANGYNRTTDWPDGTWGCVQAQQTGRNTSSMDWKVWFNGRLIIWIENFDAASAIRMQSLTGMQWNNYYNGNEVNPGTNQVTYRYEDNMIVKDGAPISCAEAGFTGAVTPEPSAGEVNLSTATPSVTEGNGGGNTSFTITATRSGGTAGAVTATIYATAGGTAEAYTDFTSDAGVVSWADGESGDKTVTFTVYADALDEPDETFNVTLSTPTGGVTIGSLDDAVATITDDDAQPTVSIGDAVATEGDGPGARAAFEVSLSAASGRILTVNIATNTGTAVADVDFTHISSSTLTFSAGTVSQIVYVDITGDVLDENSETFTALLSSPSTYTSISDGTGNGVIQDNDPTPTAIIITDNAYVPENGGTAHITVLLSAVSGRDVTADFALGGIADVDDDYTISTTSISIPAGLQGVSADFDTVNDSDDESDEFATFTLTSLTNATISGWPTSVTILDDDDPPSEPADNKTSIEGGTALTGGVSIR